MTFLPTIFPVQFFGMPDGKVCFIYARYYEIKYKRSGVEYVFAEHEEFSYDYNSEKLLLNKQNNANHPVNNELIDKPDPVFKILKIDRNIQSYTEAHNVLNMIAKEMISPVKEDRTIVFEAEHKISLNYQVG